MSTVSAWTLDGQMAAADDVLAWTAEGESDTQEFKESPSSRDAGLKTLSAMANLRGGRVLFGVRDDGTIAGVQIGARTLEDLAGAIKAHFQPELQPDIEVVEVQPGRHVIIVSVIEGRARPYSYRGKSYRRIGRTTTEMTTEEYQRLFLERHHAAERWETTASPLTLADLDADEIVASIDEAVARGRVSDPLSRDPIVILRQFGLMRTDDLTHAATVLFARPSQLLPYYTQCLVKLNVFDGTTKDNPVENSQEHLPAIALIRRGEDFFRTHLPITTTIDPDDLQRKDTPAFPVVVLREALANAVAHREYETGSGSISLDIYDDRVEISSIGTLHFGLSVAALYRPHEAQPWNPLIAGLLYRRGVVENMGSGTLRMVNACRAVKLLPPIFEDDGTSVRVTLMRPGNLPPQLRALQLSDLQEQVLEGLIREPGQSATALAAETAGSRERTVQHNLRLLSEKGLARFTGTTKDRKWYPSGQADLEHPG